MPLIDVDFALIPAGIPQHVGDFLRHAQARAQEFTNDLPATYRGFVPSDYSAVYRVLATIADCQLARGNSFCEWGSGLGVVAALAALTGFDAYGIEIDGRLHDAGEALVREFEIPVALIQGSFVPWGADGLIDQAFAQCDGGLSLEPHADDAYDELGLEVRDFDVIFAFPWPNDEELTAELFERFASRGALLLTYCESDALRLRRKMS
jgi:hypothetical protein